MPKPIEAIAENFQCCKCRNRTCAAREVTVSKGSGLLGDILGRGNKRVVVSGDAGHAVPDPGDRFVYITCGLCGYTEIYSLAILAHARDRKSVEAVRAQEKPATLRIVGDGPHSR